MSKTDSQLKLELTPYNRDRLNTLCGACDEIITKLEKRYRISISRRENVFHFSGDRDALDLCSKKLQALYDLTLAQREISNKDIHFTTQDPMNKQVEIDAQDFVLKLPQKSIKLQNHSQKQYINNIQNHTISFSIGPSGTGKTYLAVAAAAQALLNQAVERIILVRPAVDAGEKLGFLPGDLSQKVDPYLRPFYDALYELISIEQTMYYVEKGKIEIAPLAFMRGRTLSDAFIILDESQNTTNEQMKMLLTRLGHDAKMVITGDLTQIDLPRSQGSGLAHAESLLQNIHDISFTYFRREDVVRHDLIQSIITAYESQSSP